MEGRAGFHNQLPLQAAKDQEDALSVRANLNHSFIRSETSEAIGCSLDAGFPILGPGRPAADADSLKAASFHPGADVAEVPVSKDAPRSRDGIRRAEAAER